VRSLDGLHDNSKLGSQGQRVAERIGADEMSAKKAYGEISGGLNSPSIKNYSVLTTTSTALGRVRGFSIMLLLLLSKGVKRCCELAEETQKSRDYVYSYLKRLQKYGLVDISDSFWNLTDLGAWFVEYIKRNRTIYDMILKSEQKENRRRTLKEQKENRNRQINITLWSKSTDLSGAEKEVVEMLLEHYNKTGSKFILFRDMYDLAEKVKGSPEATFTAIRRLRQDNILYLYRSEIQGYWKLGLKKEFVEARLKETLSDRSYN